MLHISQCHAMITILFNIPITTFDTFHQHNFLIPQPQSMMLPIHITFQYPVKYQLYISTTTITFYNTLSNTNYISLPQLSLLILDLKALDNEIDAYLRLLIDDLKEL